MKSFRARLVASLLMAIAAGEGKAQGQWSLNGSKIYYMNGKVGIGTSNPNSPLTVVSSIGAGDKPTLLVKMTNPDPESMNAAIRATNRGVGLSGIGVWASHDGGGVGVLGEALGDGFGVYAEAFGDFGSGVYGKANGDSGVGVRGTGGPNGYGGAFNGRLYVQGNVGLGEADPQFRLHLATNSAAKPTSNTWTISSDERLKKNIKPIADALPRLMALRGVTYQWRDPSTQGGMHGTYTGMIAQDVERVFPEWVSEDAEGFKTLTVTGFEGLVVEALRELRTEKDAEIAERDRRIDALAARVEELERLGGIQAYSKENE